MFPEPPKNLKLLVPFVRLLIKGTNTHTKTGFGDILKQPETLGKLATTTRTCKPPSAQPYHQHFSSADVMACFTVLSISLCSNSTRFTSLRVGELRGAIPSAVRSGGSPTSASLIPFPSSFPSSSPLFTTPSASFPHLPFSSSPSSFPSLSALCTPPSTSYHSGVLSSPTPAPGNLSLPNFAVSFLPSGRHYTETFRVGTLFALLSNFQTLSVYTFVNLQTLRFFRLSWQVRHECNRGGIS
jgi:hypothetical protein